MRVPGAIRILKIIQISRVRSKSACHIKKSAADVQTGPFLIGLLCTIFLATVLPCHGAAVPVFQWLAILVIALMFFLQGARLSRKAVVDGVMAWRLHLIILACTFVLFPLLGLAAHA